jgi:CMP-N,N'-diacetyllegionaminic acid synthase
MLYRDKHPEHHVDVALNTDSLEMIAMIEGKEAIHAIIVPRKEELAGDNVAKKPVIADTLNESEKVKKIKYDMVVDCDITSPLRTVEDIEALIVKASSFEYDVVFSVVDSRRNPYFNMVKENQDGMVSLVMPSEYTARQQAPVIYDMNASLYAYKPEFLQTGTMILQGRCGVTKMEDTAVLDLDHENDFELMQVIANYLIKEKGSKALQIVFDKAESLRKDC